MRKDYNITGEDTLEVQQIIRSGDVILRNKSYFSNFFTFKEYTESGIYIGKNNIITLQNKKIYIDNIISFLRCSSVIILRIDETKILNNKEVLEKVIDRAQQFYEISKEFDFDLNLQIDKDFEIVIGCYKELGFLKTFNIRKRKYTYNDFSLLNSPFFKIIYKKDKGQKYE